jgi:hypothetical protein
MNIVRLFICLASLETEMFAYLTQLAFGSDSTLGSLILKQIRQGSDFEDQDHDAVRCSRLEALQSHPKSNP